MIDTTDMSKHPTLTRYNLFSLLRLLYAQGYAIILDDFRVIALVGVCGGSLE
jgi:hypothetical protein